METGDLPAAGLNPEAGAAVVALEQSPSSAEAGEQRPRQIVIKESFCGPWVEDPATFDPAQAGWKPAAEKLLAKIQEMLAAPEVTLTPDGLTPNQAAVKEQAELLAGANTRAAKLAQSLVGVRAEIAETAAEFPPAVLPDEPLLPSDTAIGQLQEAASMSPALEPQVVAAPVPAETVSSAPEPVQIEPPATSPEAGSLLERLLEQVPAEMKEEIEKRLAEFGENFDEGKFAKEHSEEYGFINQIITEAGDPAKAAEAAGKVKARLDSLNGEEDGDKKKKDFLINLFGIYKRRLNQEKDPEEREKLKKSMLGLNKELAGLGIGSLGGIFEVIIGAIVGEVQEQLK